MNRRSFLKLLGLAPVAAPAIAVAAAEPPRLFLGGVVSGRWVGGARIVGLHPSETILSPLDRRHYFEQFRREQFRRAQADNFAGTFGKTGIYYSRTCDADLGDAVCRYYEHVDGTNAVVVS